MLLTVISSFSTAWFSAKQIADFGGGSVCTTAPVDSKQKLNSWGWVGAHPEASVLLLRVRMFADSGSGLR